MTKIKIYYITYSFALAVFAGVFLVASKSEASQFANEEDRYCLAQNIYFEAGNQPFAGKLAVAHVTLNRVFDLQFPNDICGVVYQTREYRKSWTGEMVPKRGMCQLAGTAMGNLTNQKIH